MHHFFADDGTFGVAAILAAMTLLHYAVVAGGLWLLFYVVRRRHWLKRKVIADFAARSDFRRDILLSVGSCAIFGTIGVLLMLAYRSGWTRIYLDVHERGWWWFAASIVLTIVLHDAYFYWTHRLMHVRWLLPIHRAHHLSRNPTPWTAFAFSPIEACVQAGILPLAAFLYPVHPIAMVTFAVWQVGFNAMGHAGFETMPHGFADSWLRKILNTATNHAMHHQHWHSHYGLYFSYWDLLLGTGSARAELRFREITADDAASPEAAASSANPAAPAYGLAP